MAIALNIPSQIEKYLSVAFFPATGNEFTLYIANDTNRLYQWNGAAYIEVSQQDAVNWGSIGGDIINQTDLQLALAGKVDVEAGKGLSTNDYTTAEKNKLAGIEAGAQVNDVDSVNGYIGAVVLSKSDVGLSNVDNTSDLNKPISTATQNALDAKQDDITLTTTGDNGASTLVGSTLNVPNYTLSGLGGVPTSRTLTINGVTQDLSANRTFTISTGITIGSTAIASGVVGRVLFEGAGNVVQESSSLFWDNTNARLGVGTSTPITAVEVKKTGSDSWITASRGTNSFHAGFLFNPSGSWTASNVLWNFGLYANTNDLRYWTYNGSTDTNVLNLFGSTANVGIGTTTDAGFRLDVNGTARVQGNAQFGTSFYWDNTNGRLGIGTSSPTRALDIVKTIASGAIEGIKIEVNHSSSTSAGILDFVHTQFDARFRIQSIAGAGGANPTLSFIVRSTTAMSILQSGNVNIGSTTTDAGFRLDVNGTARVQDSTTIIRAQNAATSLNIQNSTNGAGAETRINLQPNSGTFSVGKTSTGTAVYKIIGANTSYLSNTTGDIAFLNDASTGRILMAAGGASTAQMTLKASGVLNLSSVPTSSAGLSAGDIWNDGGTLKIV